MNDTTAEYAEAARAYFKYHRVFRYRLKSIAEMSDAEVVQKCHWWQEENGMAEDYWQFVRERFPHLG